MKSSNRMVVRVLKASKKYLWDGIGCCLSYKVRYICNALQCTLTYGSTRNEPWAIAVGEIQDMITERIDSHHTFEDWLREQGISRNNMTTEAVQAHRLAWIDILIAEFNLK